jgi:hypothetical protein
MLGKVTVLVSTIAISSLTGCIAAPHHHGHGVSQHGMVIVKPYYAPHPHSPYTSHSRQYMPPVMPHKHHGHHHSPSHHHGHKKYSHGEW